MIGSHCHSNGHFREGFGQGSVPERKPGHSGVERCGVRVSGANELQKEGGHVQETQPARDRDTRGAASRD